MTYVIPNTFRNREETIKLSLLDQNFSSVAQQINTLIGTVDLLGGGTTDTFTQITNRITTTESTTTSLANRITTAEATTTSLLSSIATSIPAGTVMYFANSTAPSGWLECNGAAISRSTYAALFTAISTTWGAGNGSTTFNVPDLRGEFIRGWDNGRGVDSGRIFASAQAATEITATVNQAAFVGYTNADAVRAGGNYNRAGQAGYTDPQNFISVRPRNMSLLACIKV